MFREGVSLVIGLSSPTFCSPGTSHDPRGNERYGHTSAKTSWRGGDNINANTEGFSGRFSRTGASTCTHFFS